MNKLSHQVPQASARSGVPGRGKLVALASAALALVSLAPIRAAASTPGGARASYAQLPLAFEPNVGQAPRGIEFTAHGIDGTLRISAGAVELEPRLSTNSARPKVLTLKLVGAAAATPEREEPLPGVANYFLGADPSLWHQRIPTFGQVRYRGLYAGIDALYYGTQQHLEYDFVVAPGANPSAIRFELEGAERARIDASGELVMQVGGREVRQRAPRLYQFVDGKRREIQGGFALRGKRLGFRVGAYDPTQPLIIDPVLVFSSFLGGSGQDRGLSIATDSAGNILVAGDTSSLDFPTLNAAQNSLRGNRDAFVAKLDHSGTTLVYATYVGGSLDSSATHLVTDGAGNAYLVGSTSSTDFPTTSGVLQRQLAGGYDAFVTALGPSGALVFSTYFGGSGVDNGHGIALDSSGSLYIVGTTSSTDLPTAHARQRTLAGNQDAFVAKLSGNGSSLIYGTYLGGGGADEGMGIAVDASGCAYVAGGTSSSDFPTQSAAQRSSAGAYDAFAAKLGAAGDTLIYSTYLGGSTSDLANAIAIDTSGNAYLAGFTDSTDFPTPGGLQTANGGSYDAFLAELGPTGALAFATYFGGIGGDGATSVAVDGAGRILVAGYTTSRDLQTYRALQAYGGNSDAFLLRLRPGGQGVLLATYLGGSANDEAEGLALDASGNAYLTGYTYSSDFPAQAALQKTFAGGVSDAFIARIDFPPPVLASISPTYGPLCGGDTVLLTGTGFEPGTSVSFGGTPATSVTVLDGGAISAIVPPHGPSDADVVVTITDGQSSTLGAGYSYYPPVAVGFDSPGAEATVAGMVSVSASATVHWTTLDHVELYVDGVLLVSNGGSPATTALDTTTLPDGPHLLEARAYDTGTDTATAQLYVIVANNPDGGASSAGGTSGSTGTSSGSTGTTGSSGSTGSTGGPNTNGTGGSGISKMIYGGCGSAPAQGTDCEGAAFFVGLLALVGARARRRKV